MSPSRDNQVRLDTWVDQQTADDVRTIAEASDASMAEVMRTSIRAYTRRRPVYSWDGSTESFVRDAWAIRNPTEAADPKSSQDRMQAFLAWQRQTREDAAKFTTVTTGNASQVIPPGYQPLLSNWTQDRPLYNAASKGSIDNATAFTLPGQLTDSQVDAAVGTQTEGTNRTDNAAFTFTAATVAPTGIVGLFRCSREVIDGSSPALDVVALNVMRESFGRQAEARIFTELNTIQSGTITGLQVPNGAQARTSTGTALPTDLRKAVLDYVQIRGMRPRVVVASGRQTVAEGLDGLDASTVAEGSDAFYVTHGCPVYLSPQISGVAAGDGDVFILGTGDLYAWSSPLVTFRYDERQGPALVDISLFGYFATKVINPRGVSSIRHT